MVQYHIIGTYTSTYSMITDKDGEIMNGWTDEELKEFEEMMAFEERMEQDQEELRVKLNFHKQPHTDEEWKEHAIQSWLDAECTKEDLEKYYYYSCILPKKRVVKIKIFTNPVFLLKPGTFGRTGIYLRIDIKIVLWKSRGCKS